MMINTHIYIYKCTIYHAIAALIMHTTSISFKLSFFFLFYFFFFFFIRMQNITKFHYLKLQIFVTNKIFVTKIVSRLINGSKHYLKWPLFTIETLKKQATLMKYASLNKLDYVHVLLVHTNTLLCKSSLLKLPWDIYLFFFTK